MFDKFDKYTLYALNKADPDAIIFADAEKGFVHITRADCTTEEEFRFWKNWYDASLQEEETERRRHCNHTVALNEDIDATNESPEDMLIALSDKAAYDHECTKRLAQIRHLLTETQFRRFWKHKVMGMTEEQIAEDEKVGQRRISTSVTDAQKKLEKFFKISSKEGAKNG